MKLPDRFKEPSTWAGLGVLLSVVGLPRTTADAIVTAVAGIAGLVAIFVGERKSPPPNP